VHLCGPIGTRSCKIISPGIIWHLAGAPLASTAPF